MSQNLQPNSKQIDLNRPLPFYFITTTNPDELSYEAAIEALTELKNQGFGGIVLFNKPPYGFNGAQYLRKAWFDMVRNFSKACLDLELRM